MRWSICLIIFWLIVAGCATESAELDPLPRMVEQWSGSHSELVDSSTFVVRTLEEWSELWRKVGREPPRSFDGGSQLSVAVFIGQRRTGGYSVEISGIHPERDKLRVEYRERTPKSGAMVPQMITSPWLIALVAPSFSSTPIEIVPVHSREEK